MEKEIGKKIEKILEKLGKMDQECYKKYNKSICLYAENPKLLNIDKKNELEAHLFQDKCHVCNENLKKEETVNRMTKESLASWQRIQKEKKEL